VEAAKWFYLECSILGHEILGEIFLSLLLQVGQIAFHLDLANAAFLDETWLLSKRITLEFVPTKELGLCVL